MVSINSINAALLLGALMVLSGIFSSLVARRFGAPLLLVFLIVGMLAGAEGPGGIVFDNYELTYLIGSLALSIILFDGGLRAKLSSFRGALAPSIILATIGVIITAALTGAFAYLILDFRLLESLLLGAIVASTDAAAVFFLLHSGGLQLKPRINSVLEIESGTNDPVAVILTVALTEAVLMRDGMADQFGFIRLLLLQGAIGATLGVAAGMLASLVLNRITLPSGLHPLFVVASAIGTYALTSLLGGSGFLAVYLAGLTLGNRPIRAYPSIASFHDAATWLAQIVMFLVLGLLVSPSTLISYAVPAILLAAFLIFIARPIAVWACISPFKFRESEKAFISWVGLRGAVSIFLAAIPTLSGVPGAETFFNVAFFVVLVSLLLQGWTISSAARRLGIALPQLTPAINRIELDLPGQLDFELVGYPVAAESPIAQNRIRLPPRVREVMVIRSGDILSPQDAGRLVVGDYAYFLSPPNKINRLDRLIAPRLAEDETASRPIFGEFALKPEARLIDLAEAYDLALDDFDITRTIAEEFTHRFDGRPIVGDQLALGDKATLIVRKLKGDKISIIGLQLEEMIEATIELGLHKARTATQARAGKIVAKIQAKFLKTKPSQTDLKPPSED